MVFTEKRANVIHGLLLIAGFSFAAFYISNFQWVKNLSLSPLIIGILIGIVYANCLRNHLPETWVPGIKFCTKQILRLGIILYGFKLTIQNVVAVGLPSLVVDTIIVSGTIMLGLLFGKILKIDRETALMTSTGSAICGAAAVLGAEPIVKCEPHKTAVAVTTVVIFGTLSMFIYPIMYRSGILHLTPQQMAIYTGSTLHEVAHVVGAGNAVDPDGSLMIAGQATITKMIRVMLLAPVLVIMGLVLSRKKGPGETENETKTTSDNKTAKKRSKITIPWFAFGFIGIILFNSLLNSCSFLPQKFMGQLIGGINNFDTFLLTMAMTALGAETSFDKFKQAGAKPFYLAGLIYIWLLGGGYLLAKYFVPLF